LLEAAEAGAIAEAADLALAVQEVLDFYQQTLLLHFQRISRLLQLMEINRNFVLLLEPVGASILAMLVPEEVIVVLTSLQLLEEEVVPVILALMVNQAVLEDQEGQGKLRVAQKVHHL
jgi:hypothetical protein